MKKINLNILLSTLFCFVFIHVVEAQGWRKTYPYLPDTLAIYAGFGKTLLSTSDGGFIVVGDRQHVRTDSEGNAQWIVSSPNTEYSYPPRIAALLDDGTYAFISVVEQGNTVGYLTKNDAFGNEIWQVEAPLTPIEPQYLRAVSIDVAQNGDFILAFNFSASGTSCNCSGSFLYRYDSNGQLVWSIVNDQLAHHRITSLKVLSDGNFITAGYKGPSQSLESYIEKRDINGDLLWEKTWTSANAGVGTVSSIIESSDGTLLAMGGNEQNAPSNSPFYLTRLSQSGDEIWVNIIDLNLGIQNAVDLRETPSGDVVMVGEVNESIGFIVLTDSNGDEIWRRTFEDDQNTEGFYSVQVVPDGGFAICGHLSSPMLGREILLLKTDSLGNIYTHQIIGKVFNDEDMGCDLDSTEEGLSGWVVQAVGDETFYGSTNSNGEFSMLVDTGEYNLSVTPTWLWEGCQPTYSINAINVYDTTEIDIPLQAEYDCPLMEVDISTSFIRPCSLGFYSVQYCNLGSEIATDATIEIELADGLEYVSTTGDLLSQNGQTLLFGIGNVDINECGSFSLTFDADCDTTLIGQTLCTEAHIFPDTICLDSLPIPNIEVSGFCENDSVKFEIQNVGDDMQDIFEYIIIEDNIILLQGDFQLPNGAIHNVEQEAMSGSTYHLVAAQDVNFPSYLGNPVATFSLEGCVGSINPGALNEIIQDIGEPWLDTHCQLVTASYDPNDKTPTPTGWTEDHLITPKTDLEYRIRFQNTGTDTAFNVVIVDTLSQFLDPLTIRPGAASHAYSFELSGQGVAKFKFSNILLPDSTTNEAASHGFVNFKISQITDNQPGTLIENNADIYFDFNPPIRTNTTFHTIGEPWVSIVSGTVQTEDVRHQVRVFPNPFFESATFELEGFDQSGTLEIFDMNGRLVLSQNFAAGQAQIERGQLTEGVYFFQMRNENGVMASGKVVLK